MSEVIPACRPLLPGVDRLVPYLRRIDSARVYSNWGPLSLEFEERIAAQLGQSAGCVVSAASGTSALIGAILATAGAAANERPIALLPGFTFVATALAAERCGYRPAFVDVDSGTWQMDPELLDAHPLLDSAGLVIPVAPFGRGVPLDRWESFRQRTGLPVVIDGGASFEAVSNSPQVLLGRIPVALSFHATKSLSTGEGGCVISTDSELCRSVARALNFGFFGSRQCHAASTNGKMSEYHAAVGLAELDGWPDKRAAFNRTVCAYRTRLAAANLHGGFVAAPAIASCYALLECDHTGFAQRVKECLERSNIEHRSWYGDGLHLQPLYASGNRERLAICEKLCATVLGLPMACDLSDESLDRIVSAITGGLQ